jgi:hypothetical protein
LEEYIVTYNAENKPVTIEKRDLYGKLLYEVNYGYNDYGYTSLMNGKTETMTLKYTAEYDAQGKILFIETYRNGEIANRYSYEYYDETHFSSSSYTFYGEANRYDYSCRDEYKYGADGKLEAYYRYNGDELQYYVNFYYGNSSSVKAVPENVARVWSSGGQLYIAGATSGMAQVYTVSGRLLKTVSFTSGQTTATPLPRGIYIVAAAGRTWKVIGE